MLIYLVLISLVCCYIYLKLSRRREDQKNRPSLMPGALPIIGHAYMFLGDSEKLWLLIQEFAKECLKKRGVVVVKIFSWSWYIIAEPDDFYNVSNNCLEKGFMYSYAKPWLGDGLLTGEMFVVRRHRKLISPAFNQKVLDGYLDIFNDRSRCLVETLSVEVGKGPVIILNHIKQSSLDTLLLTVMGLEYEKGNIDQHKEYRKTASKLYELIHKRLITYWMLSDFFYNLSTTKTQTDQAIKIAHNYVDELIKKKKAALHEANSLNNSSQTGPKFISYLDLVLDLSMNGAMTDNEIRDEVNTMVAVGYDTTAVTIYNALIMIGSYPHVQKRVYDELKEVLGNNSKDVEKDDLVKLIYLDAVIKEIIRLYPIAPVMARRAEKDIQLKNCCLPTGSSCFLFPYALHRHSIWGPDADEFKPERWLDPTMLPHHPGAYAGFSIGRRSCLGTKFVMTSMKTTLSHIIRRYEVYADYTKVKWTLNIVLEPASGHHIAFEYRTN